MKKIIYIASFLCTALLAGCDDFLTTESPDFSTDKYWRDKADVEAGLSAVYGQLDNRTGSYAVAEVKFVVETFRSDEMIKAKTSTTIQNGLHCTDSPTTMRTPASKNTG